MFDDVLKPTAWGVNDVDMFLLQTMPKQAALLADIMQSVSTIFEAVRDVEGGIRATKFTIQFHDIKCLVETLVTRSMTG